MTKKYNHNDWVIRINNCYDHYSIESVINEWSSENVGFKNIGDCIADSQELNTLKNRFDFQHHNDTVEISETIIDYLEGYYGIE